MSIRDRLRDLKQRTKSRFNESVSPPKPMAITSNLPSTSVFIKPSPSAAREETKAPEIAPTSTPSSSVTSENHAAPRNAWASLKALSRVLDPVASAFGPLKVVIDELVGLIELYERAANGREEYVKVQSELEPLFEDLQRHFSQPTAPLATLGVESLCKSIQGELDYIKKKQTRGGARKYLDGKGDPVEILACYRRVQTLLHRLSLNVNMSIWSRTAEQVAETRSDRMSTKLDRLHPSLSARYNSAQALELKRGSCTPGTRINVLDRIYSWTLTVGKDPFTG